MGKSRRGMDAEGAFAENADLVCRFRSLKSGKVNFEIAPNVLGAAPIISGSATPMGFDKQKPDAGGPWVAVASGDDAIKGNGVTEVRLDPENGKCIVTPTNLGHGIKEAPILRDRSLSPS